MVRGVRVCDVGVDVLTFVLSRFVILFFFKQKTAYEMRISDWSSDVCSSDLTVLVPITVHGEVAVESAGNTSQKSLGSAGSAVPAKTHKSLTVTLAASFGPRFLTST